ncbi:MAG: hypothetical protein Q7S43_05185 [bacterium]|nr:hypothetical protein [bacterium]
MTEVQLAKITVEVARLRAQADDLEAKAERDDRMFLLALSEYGSELAGPPQSIAMNRNKAKELRKRAEFFESVKMGDVHLSDPPALENRVMQINKQIEDLQKDKVDAYLKIRLLQQLAEVVGD